MKIYFVDSFTREKFKGNPAAVCFLEDELPDSTMQDIAIEIGFSETAFVSKGNGDKYRIRFFTPKKEIPLCGHATLAASKIMFDQSDRQEIRFINCEDTELHIGKADDKIVMQFPVYDTEEISVPRTLLNALGITEMENSRLSERNKIILIEIDNAEKLASLRPDYMALLTSYTGINGVLVTSVSTDNVYDFHYRYFWPWAGTNEDPVTGGVQTFLTKYWAEKLGKTRLNCFQSSERTGYMTTEYRDDKVLIYGDAVIILEGEMNA
ncbi:PhzF family phenazine biosynthesis protein [Pollutibacter soli]|uniref:PhzF family phenazine biosynthesis protein n=1 Tax=Pollutibacter soli TaxID=3034157 RepID=UPI003013D29F